MTACFRCGVAGNSPAPAPEAQPIVTTSVYDTHLGLVSLTWSRTAIGLSLAAEIQLSGAGDEPLRLAVRPWLFWRRRGSRVFDLESGRRRRSVELSWDLRRARFPPHGGPEPMAGFYVVVAVDGEMIVAAGDVSGTSRRRTKASGFQDPALVSRREHVIVGDAAGRRSYGTSARFGGRDREITIEVGPRDGKDHEPSMSVAIDGERALNVRRLSWKFRGTAKINIEGGRMCISWNLHNWLFSNQSNSVAAASPEDGRAVFIFRFERDEGQFGNNHLTADVEKGHFGKTIGANKTVRTVGGQFGKNFSDSSSGVGVGVMRKHVRLRNVSSSSSSTTSSTSSTTSWTVAEWASQEEVELNKSEGFTLVVYAFKR